MVIGSIGGGSSSSGGTSMWGQASTAHFHGAGSPVGVVLPSGKGDLYIDDTTPALWQANGATHTDWQQVGGAAAGPTYGTMGPTQTIANGAGAKLTWGPVTTTTGPGTLIKLTTGTHKNLLVTEAGIYSIGVTVNAPAMTAAGYWMATLATPRIHTFSLYPATAATVSATLVPIVAVLPKTTPITVHVYNRDGVAARAFKIGLAIVQKLV